MDSRLEEIAAPVRSFRVSLLARVQRWIRHPFVAYTLFPAVFLLVFTRWDFDSRLKEVLTAGVASYPISTRTAEISPTLVQKVLFDPIRDFDQRRVVLLLGNSVFAGLGAEDMTYLNRSLANDFNVINVSYPGEYFSGTIALATLALNELAVSRRDRKVDVFIAYPLTKFYAHADYWAFEKLIGRLCKDRRVDEYVYDCERLGGYTSLEVAAMDFRNAWSGAMSCLITQELVMRWIKSGRFFCGDFFSEFRRRFPRTPPLKFPPALSESSAMKTREELLSAISKFESTSYRNEVLARIVDRSGRLARYTQSRSIDLRFHFLFLPESLDAVETLGVRDRTRYFSIRSKILTELRLMQPGWRVADVSALSKWDHSDTVHLNESGQLNLAKIIKARVLMR